MLYFRNVNTGAAIGHPIVRDTVYGYNGSAAAFGGLPVHVLPTNSASIELQQAIADASKHSSMCVHAKRIQLKQPLTGIDLVFTSTPSF
jgi:23S rRNA-/tRNA-specific pseudouridylate synthase